ncbi:MAG TPA: cytochrome C [Paracoccus sp. (in: a-proteobacteria)]|uniref:c-type cytochrome n=1 Tax=uncultured Paracoccus sp. TaxID=189685 RepID=UPI00261D8B8E|nr:cytochrome C [uncultured Paracoccus sp.]HMQ41839.1 cytochrome C [Paracoccus sp. (in: a-proteobacteria)]HMR36681.1 cytochrome C [Paracoccus sp. (in: a-proteobacteria)]
MKTRLIAALTLTIFAAPALAQDAAVVGDAAKGEKEFNKCKACHMIQSPDGEDIVKGGKTGPNLYGVVGRHFAVEEGYKYGEGILELAAANPDAVWDIHSLKAYVTDPTGYLDHHSGNEKAKSKMTFKLSKNQDDLVAYLVSVSPDAPAQPAEGDGSPQAPQ